MGKRKPKKSSSFSTHSTTLNENNLSDSSSCQDISTSSSCRDSNYFKVLLCQSTENKDEYKKWTKNCYWKNIAFIRPSTLSESNSFVLIRGKSNFSVFLTIPLKSVKNGSVVLLNGMGFHNEEMVTLHPLEGVCDAKEICFTVESPPPFECLQDMLLTKLSNKFIWSGLNLQFVLFDAKYECVISKILSHKEFPKSNCLADASAEQMSSLFSTLNLSDSLDCVLEEEDAASVNCFITNACSTVVMSDSFQRKPELFPLFKHIGGCSPQIEIIRKYIDTFLKIKIDKVLGSAHILLLTGPSKSAKNMTIRAIFNEYGIPTMKMNLSSLISQAVSATMKEIKLVVRNVPKSSPSFLMLDKLELFCSRKTKDQISNLFQHLKECPQALIVASVSSEFAFDKQLFKSFSVQEVRFTLPSFFDREEIIQKIEQKQELSSTQLKHCAELLQGLSSGDIFKILKFDAPRLSLIREKNTSFIQPESNFHDILNAIKKRKSCLSALKADKVKWSDIGGMEEIKKELMEEIEFLTKTPSEKLKQFNICPSQGILLYGPPGCSKTMIAKALATECNWNFFSKKASDIMNMYVGESEKAVANLFLEARDKAPSIIFLDEIDAIAPARYSSPAASGVQNRVVNTLLSEMSGIETLKNVIVIAATNRPDIIDHALLRWGRIGKHIYVPLPDCKTRKELFRLSMKNRRVSEDVDFDVLVEKTEGYSGAEIVQLCNEAAMQLLMEEPECQSPVFKTEHFNRALRAVLPLTRKDTIHFYEQFSMKNSKRKVPSL